MNIQIIGPFCYCNSDVFASFHYFCLLFVKPKPTHTSYSTKSHNKSDFRVLFVLFFQLINVPFLPTETSRSRLNGRCGQHHERLPLIRGLDFSEEVRILKMAGIFQPKILSKSLIFLRFWVFYSLSTFVFSQQRL